MPYVVSALGRIMSYALCRTMQCIAMRGSYLLSGYTYCLICLQFGFVMNLSNILLWEDQCHHVTMSQ